MKNQNKIIILSSLILGTLTLTLGITLAVFNYQGTTNNQQLILGDIYMHYQEVNALNLENTLPGDDYSEYFEFKISGKNTYTKKDIYYDIKLTRGDLPNGKTEDNRISDNYLKFKLVEVNGDTETEIIKDKTYQELTNQVIHAEKIAKNTTSEVNKTYRLYMTISDELMIGNTSEAMYTPEEWKVAFASVKVNVTGDFSIREVPITGAETMKKAIAAKAETTPTCKTTVEEDGIIYISGTKTCINFNYVWYSGKLWRITAIYPDGTMKMITDGMITSIAYGENNKFYTDENTSSYMYQWLNQEFLPTLYNYENIIVEDAVWNASPGDGTISSKLPIEGQEEVLVNASVGLLNSYEYYKSYQNTVSGSGYLNVGYYWWLLNSYSASSSKVWDVNDSGNNIMTSGNSPSTTIGVRPYIYLKSGVQLIGGTGTESNPYRIKGDQEQAKANVTLISTRQSGEYVNFGGYLYRIVGIENQTTKLIKDDYVKDESSTILTKAVASSSTFGKDTNTQIDNYWDYYLNKTWKPAITDDYEKMLLEGTYYIKSFTGGNYKNTACATISNATSIKDCDKTGVSTWSGYVGLPRYGEMFASQPMNYTYNNAKSMWLITPYSSSNVCGLTGSNYGYYTSPAASFGVRPTIHLNSNVVIESGAGTKNSPYEIKLG